MFKVLVISIMSISILFGCKPEVSFNEAESVTREGINGTIEEPGIQPPLVQIFQSPKDQIVGEDNEVLFKVIKGTYNIANVVCYIDNQISDCDGVKGTLKIEKPALGDHTVQIVATDSEGNEGSANDFWAVHDQFGRTTDRIVVNPGEKLSDILFVIDNSGSMAQEQKGVGEKINKFFEKLGGLNWRVGIVTTDPDGEDVDEDGRMLTFPDGKYFLNSDLSTAKAKEYFSKTIQRKEEGSGNERGIRSVYRSIERAVNPRETSDFGHQKFFRKGAALSVVVVSDEDETFRQWNDPSVVLPEQEKSSGANLLSFVKKTWGQDKLFQWNSIITRPGDKDCLTPVNGGNPGGTGLAYGVHYNSLSRLTNGVVGDICSNDYSSDLQLIAKEVANLQTTYQLSCEPQDVDRDGRVDFEASANDGTKTPKFTINGSKVTFDTPLANGGYTFHYFCLN